MTKKPFSNVSRRAIRDFFSDCNGLSNISLRGEVPRYAQRRKQWKNTISRLRLRIMKREKEKRGQQRNLENKLTRLY